MRLATKGSEFHGPERGSGESARSVPQVVLIEFRLGLDEHSQHLLFKRRCQMMFVLIFDLLFRRSTPRGGQKGSISFLLTKRE